MVFKNSIIEGSSGCKDTSNKLGGLCFLHAVVLEHHNYRARRLAKRLRASRSRQIYQKFGWPKASHRAKPKNRRHC